MIPEEAIKAAREQLEAMGSYVSRDYAEAALDAAAPHIIQAWVDETAMLPQIRHRGPIYPLGHIEDKRR